MPTNNSKPLVSVLIGAYNHQDYVAATIQSIIEQTYSNIELIVIDDGSTDATWERIKAMQSACEQRFQRVVFQTKNNEGSCATVNKLLDLAKSEFVYLIASDDLAKPTAIEKELAFLTTNPEYAMVMGDDEFIDKNGKRCYWDKNRNIIYDIHKAASKTYKDHLQRVCNIQFNSDDFGAYDKLYIANHIPNGYLVRKSIFNIIGKFTYEAPLEDYWLMLQISKYAKIKFLDEVLFSYRWHDSNTIKKENLIIDYVQKTRAYENKLLDNIDDKTVLPAVLKIKYGVLEKIIGIPYIATIETKYLRLIKQKRVFKIFNFPVFIWCKKN